VRGSRTSLVARVSFLVRMQGEDSSTAVGSSAHLATGRTTTTAPTSSTSSITSSAPPTSLTHHPPVNGSAGSSRKKSSSPVTTTPSTTTTTCPSSSVGSGKAQPFQQQHPHSSSSTANRLSQVSLKKSEDGSLSVSLVEPGGGGGGGSSSSNRRRSSSHHHHHHQDDPTGSDEDEDGSKMELELQFAGIDNETVELELDEDDNQILECSVVGGTNNSSNRESPPAVGGGGGSSSGGLSSSCAPSMLPPPQPSSPLLLSPPHHLPPSGGGAPPPLSSPGAVEGGEEDEEDVEGGKTVECTEVIVPIQTLAEKCLFYVTAFFILLAVFSLFAFLFLVPFVIDPAFTTIFMEFDPEPASCITVSNVVHNGSSKCNWTSCREGCTREMFTCRHIKVNYRKRTRGGDSSGSSLSSSSSSGSSTSGNIINTSSGGGSSSSTKKKNHSSSVNNNKAVHNSGRGKVKHKVTTSEVSSSSEWDYTDAHLFPNVKACGYPPAVNCSVFFDTYGRVNSSFDCYYSKVDRGMVVTSYDMSRVIMDLVYSMAIPIPSFIISVVYLIFAYFRIYNTDSSSSSRRPGGGGVVPSSTNNNIQGSGGSLAGDPADPNDLSADDKTKIISKSSSRGLLNAVGGVGGGPLVPNSGKHHHTQMIEMNDLNPPIHNSPSADGDLLLPRRNNRAPERNGPANPAAKNKGYTHS